MKTMEHEPWTKWDIVIAVIGTSMFIYHLVSTQYLLVSALAHQNIHLAFALTLLFLSGITGGKQGWRTLPLTFVLLSLISTGYIHIFEEEILWRQGFPEFPDVIIGTILIILVLEATRKAFGLVLPSIALLFLLYAAFGHLLPAPFYTMQYSYGKLISKFSMLAGLYGTILGISASYLFLFVAFGAVLQISGASKFFIQFGRLAGARLSGGSALTAVIGSALFGTVSGSVAANIVTSGSYTIPLMKGAGYKPEQAAAMEAAASTGGQIMPPIMGAAAFVMAGITGISYLKIIIVAAVPALLYFFVIGLYAQLQALKLGIRPSTQKIVVKEVLSTSYLFIIPMGTLVVLLIIGYTVMYAIFWTIILLMVLSMLRKKTRPSFSQWIKSFSTGAKLGAEIGVCCALIGLILTCMTLTGLGLKLPGIIATISGGKLVIALLLTAVAALILGCGMPTTAVYVLVVIATAPALIGMGLPVLTAHMFVFFFAVMNFVTLPVAIGAMVASKLAGANFVRTGIESMKAALGGFLIPFLIILAPVLLLQPQGTVLQIITQVICSLVILVAFEIVVINHYIRPFSIPQRIVTAISGLTLLAFLITKSYIFTIGFAPLILVTLWQLRHRKANPQSAKC